MKNWMVGGAVGLLIGVSVGVVVGRLPRSGDAEPIHAPVVLELAITHDPGRDGAYGGSRGRDPDGVYRVKCEFKDESKAMKAADGALSAVFAAQAD